MMWASGEIWGEPEQCLSVSFWVDAPLELKSHTAQRLGTRRRDGSSRSCPASRSPPALLLPSQPRTCSYRTAASARLQASPVVAHSAFAQGLQYLLRHQSSRTGKLHLRC